MATKKRSTVKKMIGLCLILSLAVSILAACSGVNKGNDSSNEKPAESISAVQSPTNTSTGGDAVSEDYGDTGGLQLPLVDKPTTITWMIVGENDINDSLVAKEIEKRTGIKVDFQVYSNQVYSERLKVTLSSGKLPDIFHGLDITEVKKMGQEGAIVAINDYMDVLPNFKRLFVEENPWVIGSYGDDSGNLYNWPVYNFNRDVNFGFMYRKDIFDKHDIKEWTNTEEFLTALRKLKEVYPDSYPYASKTQTEIFSDWSYGWGIGGTSYPASYNESSGKWRFSPTTSEHKEMLDFMKTLFNEGLLDPEFITETIDSWTVKMTNNNDAFVTYDWIGRLDLFYNQVKDVNPDYNLRYGNPVGPTGHIRSLERIDNWRHVIAKSKNSEVALKLLDYLASPSGSELITLGVEGVNFEFDADGKPVYPELSDVANVDIKVLEDRYGMWMEGMYIHPDRRSVYYNYTEKEQEAQDKIVLNNLFEPLDPVVNLKDSENAEVIEIKAELKKAAEEFNMKYIFEKNNGDAEWENWQKKATSLGAERYIEIMNDAQARLDASLK